MLIVTIPLVGYILAVMRHANVSVGSIRTSILAECESNGTQLTD